MTHSLIDAKLDGGSSVQLQWFFHQGKETLSESPSEATAVGMERRDVGGWASAKASESKFKQVPF